MTVWLVLAIAAWFAWAILASSAVRFVLRRWVLRFDAEWASFVACYAVMIGLAFVEYSGWNLKGMNREPLQQAATFVLIFSPIGLPLIVGGPIVFVWDFLRAWRRSEDILA